jgi:hypothetical protein
MQLARRVDPNVQYLSDGYEKALFRYYRRLWERYPAEMRDIYLVKSWYAGGAMISVISERPDVFFGGELLRAIILPLSWVSNGLTLTVLYLTALLVGLIAVLRTGSRLALLVCFFAAAASLLQLETAAMIPFFHMSHHGSQLLCHLVVCVVVWQLGIEGCRIVGRWSAERVLRSSVRRLPVEPRIQLPRDE